MKLLKWMLLGLAMIVTAIVATALCYMIGAREISPAVGTVAGFFLVFWWIDRGWV